MKPIVATLGVLGGFVGTLGLFGSGVAVAMLLPYGEPGRILGQGPQVSELWTAKPRSVDKAAQHFDRLPSTQLAVIEQPNEGAGRQVDVVAETWTEVDPIMTSAATSAPFDEEPTAEPVRQLSTAHMEWCEDKYRSYRADENVYLAYSGELRECVSPYSNDVSDASVEAYSDLPRQEDYAATDAVYMPAADSAEVFLSSDHIQECFSRYRSYRPEDNSYQPYDGGPRRQCQ